MMDPSAEEPAPRAAAAEGAEQSRRRPGVAVRSALGVVAPFAASFLFSFLVGLAGLALGGLSSTASVSMPSTCRILSTGVDLRSSKVCELGLLNYRAKHVFYPLSNRKFRCHDDYYWASVFQVEYTEYFSGQTSYAVAEAPKEALPQNCRPDFGVAWSTTLKFKVNESYSCRYTLGSSKADIYSDRLFNCTAEEPSTIEMLKRIFVLYVYMLLKISHISTASTLHYLHIVLIHMSTLAPSHDDNPELLNLQYADCSFFSCILTMLTTYQLGDV
ncbi:hypothetical protein E2562_014860 [Oryza meyeriana var. granulata]|uniref:Uncharacterized protein n=1 Tax=Oryza meyeriana var. granulata TaxID=110450 RepID=A0A6G1BXB9_9ORYZ|nr:hypothetical protein E2562_014860 [Oryza meyeriana var. granulata]